MSDVLLFLCISIILYIVISINVKTVEKAYLKTQYNFHVHQIG